jgi:hypothetical protein
MNRLGDAGVMCGFPAGYEDGLDIDGLAGVPAWE